MKKQNKIIYLISLLLLIFLCSTCALADEFSDVVVSLQIDNPIMEVNGSFKEVDVGRGTKPIVINGRTLVPIRAVIEAFGGSVNWNGNLQQVTLNLEDDTINLTINSTVAYLNGKSKNLDVAPCIIEGRTMLPIRFVAEGFNLAVAWEGETQTVSIIKNSFDSDEYNYLISVLPKYSGQAYTFINNNIPFFKDYEIINGSFEFYGNLDSLGRCDVTFASIASDIMPTEKRESISSVIPTGWINKKYDNVEGGYLYNRCHLIGFQLTGENANDRNLITGTRYLNVEGMLPFENLTAEYIEKTGNRVMYRSTPVFTGDNLVADGVLMEAYSVEDGGMGVSFCVFCYNVQPQIQIDYKTGESTLSGGVINNAEKWGVYRTPSGKRYHSNAECGGKNSFAVTLQQALAAGLTPCSKCAK